MIKVFLIVTLVTLVSSQSQTLSFFDDELTVTYTPGRPATQFIISAAFDSKADMNNVWIAVGFNRIKRMGGTNAVICVMNAGKASVENYIIRGHLAPTVLNPKNPSIGLSDATVKVTGRMLTCSFMRENSNNYAQYYDIMSANRSPYVIVAYGSVDDGEIEQHENAAPTVDPVIFDVQTQTINLKTEQHNDGHQSNSHSNKKVKAKTHGCMMIIAWMLLASTAIVVARYYKYIFPNFRLFKVNFWFNIHRPFMILIVIVELVAFMVILSSLDWSWVETDDKVNFVHSIFGITTIGLSIIQVSVAFFRPHPGTPKRYIFNYFHRSVGLSAFGLSIVTIFLGVLIDDMNLGQTGWKIMIGWTFWVFIFPSLLETADHYVFSKLRKNPTSQVTNSQELIMDDSTKEKEKTISERIKSVLLPFHLAAALAFTISLLYVIARH